LGVITALVGEFEPTVSSPHARKRNRPMYGKGKEACEGWMDVVMDGVVREAKGVMDGLGGPG
jgi:hypothetical protein